MLNIKDIFKRFTINKTSSIGFYLCIISIFFPVVYTLVRFYLLNSGLIITPPFQEIFNLIPTIGLFLFPLGLAIISVGLSLHSQDIATDSDNKMKSIANSNFLEICSEFTDKRIQRFQHPTVLGIEGTIWKCRQYIEWANELEERVDQKHQDELAKRFRMLLDNTFDWKNGIPINVIVNQKNGKQKIKVQVMKIKNKDVNNILIMYQYFWGIKKEDNQLKGLKKISNDQKSEMIKLLEKHIAKRKKGEMDDVDFINNVQQEIPMANKMNNKFFKKITNR